MRTTDRDLITRWTIATVCIVIMALSIAAILAN